MPEPAESQEPSASSKNPPTSQTGPTFKAPEGPDVFACFKNAAALVESVLLRQVKREMDGEAPAPPPSAPDPILGLFDRLISSFKSGVTVEPVKDEIAKLLANQSERAELINNLLVMHDCDRLPGYLKLRSVVESFLIKAGTQSDLTPAEGLALLKITQDEIDAITSRIRSGATPVKDVAGLIDRTDFVNKLSEKELAQKFAATSFEGREILRKTGFRLLKALKGAKNG